MMMRTSIALALIAACGGGNSAKTGTDGGGSADAGSHVFMDAPAVISATMIKISGIASASDNNGSTPLAGVVVAFFKSSDETTPLATQTSDATGAYSFMIPTGGIAVDGFVEATISGYATNYDYPTTALTADWSSNPNMVTNTNFGLLGGFTGQMTTMGFITAEILDSADASVKGATISSSPAAKYVYDSGSFPTGTTSTDTDGVGYFINAPATGEITISAQKAGMTFVSHTLKAHAGALTTTTITP
jgi:hypothetical protein